MRDRKPAGEIDGESITAALDGISVLSKPNVPVRDWLSLEGKGSPGTKNRKKLESIRR